MNKVAHVVFPILTIWTIMGCASDEIPLTNNTCAEGQTQCAGAMIEKCHAGRWQPWSDCSVNGFNCAPIDGVAQCYGTLDTTIGNDSTSGQDSATSAATDSTSGTSINPDSESHNDSADTATVENGFSDTVTAGIFDTNTAVLDTTTGNGDPFDTTSPDTATVTTDSGATDTVASDTTKVDADTVNTDTVDTEAVDTVTVDTETVDTETVDTETVDTETVDTETVDTETVDTETVDTETVDTETVDTETVDTETVDTETVDTEFICGNGILASNEDCDDNNTVPLDGCSPECRLEPDCMGVGACSAICGDGIVVGTEECDDGNLNAGDGCSASCTVESGYTCTNECTVHSCETISLRAVYRDFLSSEFENGGHVDFQNSACEGLGVLTNGIEAELSDAGKPIRIPEVAPDCIQHLDEWYSGDADLIGELVLFKEGGTSSSYINRYGEDGERWDGFYNGTPVFFPLDALDSPETAGAQIPPEYGGAISWSWESDFYSDAPEHNFYFTSELVYWFEHQTNNNAILKIMGDDDFWVFINGQLVLDYGGIHTPTPDWSEDDGEITLDESMADALSLEDGQVYSIRIFHAERKWAGSSLRLRLKNFTSVQSHCDNR